MPPASVSSKYTRRFQLNGPDALAGSTGGEFIPPHVRMQRIARRNRLARPVQCAADRTVSGASSVDVQTMEPMPGASRTTGVSRHVWVLLVVLLVAACGRVTNSPHAAGAERTNTFF